MDWHVITYKYWDMIKFWIILGYSCACKDSHCHSPIYVSPNASDHDKGKISITSKNEDSHPIQLYSHPI